MKPNQAPPERTKTPASCATLDDAGNVVQQTTWPCSRRLRIETAWQETASAIFTELIVSRAARALHSARWSVAPLSLAALPGTVLLHHHHSSWKDEWLLDFPPSAFALIEHQGENIFVRVAAHGDAEARRIFSQIRAAVPEATLPSRSVRVKFWTLGTSGPRVEIRELCMPPWAEIERNYPVGTFDGLTPLLADTWRPHAGRLLLWHGDPGTGKTHAVRALIQAWKGWCSFHVVLDPEKFFGSNAEYMVNVLLTPDDDDDAMPHRSGGAPRWRLLILEDTGELLSIDAKDRAGQGVSRLLNLCDGLLGQSLNVLVLITTNEDVGRMHPAVVRPGRCLSNVAFKRFDGAEARRWLVDHGVTSLERNITATSLADLYMRLDGRAVPDRQCAVGFLPG